MNQDTFISILFKYRETTLPLLNLTITVQQSGELRMCWSVPSWAEAELRYWHWPQWLRWQSGWRCELRLSPLFLLLEPPESLLQSLVLCNNLVQLLLQMLDLTVTWAWGLQCPHYSWAYLLSVSGLGSKCLYFGLQLSGGWGDRRICCMLEITSLWPPPHPLEATKSPAPSSELQQCMSVEWWNRTAAVCYVVWSDVQLS